MKEFNRLNDRYFKFLFANPKYKFLLIEFLNEVLADIPADVERLSPVEDLGYADREGRGLFLGAGDLHRGSEFHAV
ncbi:MAG: hypothetical protein IJ702_09975 [Fretibacterium sp.]|nr:hypothetical protein [Fretibacterium sp.]